MWGTIKRGAKPINKGRGLPMERAKEDERGATVCERAVFRVLGARYLPGEAFDPVSECRRGRKATVQTLGRLPGRAVLEACDALCSRGHLEAAGPGLYSLTDEGEARYRADFDAVKARARGRWGRAGASALNRSKQP